MWVFFVVVVFCFVEVFLSHKQTHREEEKFTTGNLLSLSSHFQNIYIRGGMPSGQQTFLLTAGICHRPSV